MFKDDVRHRVWNQVQAQPVRCFARFLTRTALTEAAEQCGLRIGTSALNLVHMVWLGVCYAISSTRSFASILTVTFKLLDDAGALSIPSATSERRRSNKGKQGRKRKKGQTPRRSKHDPRASDPTKVSEEAFVKARGRMPLEFWIALTTLLADRFAEEHDDLIRWKHFRLLAMDGSLINLPRWKALRDYFGAARGRRGGRTPQVRMMMLQFPLTRVPYRYALAPKKTAEKTIAMELLRHVRPNDLLLIDRGFWSYGLFALIQQHGAFFATRKIENVNLKVVRRLGPKDALVRLTPSLAKWKKAPWPPSLELRRIDYQVRGFRPSALITNVLDPKVISRAEWVGMAVHEAGEVLRKSIYHRRWEIEITFSELKVRQGLRALRGRKPSSIKYEIASHVLLYLMVRWLMVEAAKAHGLDPLRLSFTEALQELRDMLPALTTCSKHRVGRILLLRLLSRIADHVVPERPGRHYPRPNDTKTKDLGYGKKRKPAKLAG
jgi:hypothetical protein